MPLLLAGQLLDGKYRVEREVSRGGAGVVYAATHQLLGTRVAIKVLAPPGVGTGDSGVSLVEPERFLREARLAAQLRHPNVVGVLDYGVAAEGPYLVMELVDGEPLRASLAQQGKLAPSELSPLVLGIAAALDAAHARGVVHRDLKPENVIVEQAGRAVKVVDFGLACTVDESAADAGLLLGTPAYLSPEQAEPGGARGAVTPASDRWALGVLAFECLTGRRPFGADALGELILQICQWPLPVPSDCAEVPPGFDAWFAKACAREPQDRFATAGEQAAALAAVLAPDRPGAPARGSSSALPNASASSLPRPPRTRALRGWALAAVALAAVAGALALVAPRRPSAPGARGAAPPLAARPAPDEQLRLAVLPLAGAADEPTAALRAGLTEAILDGLLARTEHKVIALAKVAHLGPGALDEVLARLGAQRVVVGTLARVGGELSLFVEVVDQDQTRLWASRFTHPEHELEQLGDAAARALAAVLGAPRARAVEPLAPRDPAAYRAYLYGRFFWAKRDHASLLRAIEYFRDATATDPKYARAWVGLSDSYLLLPWMGATPRAEAHQRAREALGQALLLAPDSSEAHASRGNQLLEIDWSFAEAERAFRRAIELDPRNASAHQWLAELLMVLRRSDEALAEMQLALELEPLSAAVHKNHGKVLFYARRYAEAAAAWRKSIELDPGQPWAYHGLAYALARQGRFDEALATVRAEPLWRQPELAPFLAVQELWIAHLRGDRAGAARARAVVERAGLGRVAPWTKAFVHALAGEVPALCEALARAVRERDPFTPLTVVTREFEPYFDEPCVRAQLAELGL